MNNVYLNVIVTIIALTLVGSFFVQLFDMFIAAWVGDNTERAMMVSEDYLPQINQNVADVEYWVSP